jgi:hypothetical protein
MRSILRAVALLLLLTACEEEAATEVVSQEEATADAGSDAGPDDAGQDAGRDAGAPDAGAPDSGPRGISVARMGIAAYHNPVYRERCRVSSRRNAEEATTVESKDDARDRARALARADQLDEVLLFARLAYGETGTPQSANDDPSTPLWDEAHAFLAVLDNRRGRRISRVEMMAAYSPRRVFPHPENERNRWIAELDLRGRRPPAWPAWRGARWHQYPPWRSYGCPRWLAAVDAARRLLRSVPARVGRGPCEEVPDHWGGRPGVDDEALERGWRIVDCGRTQNRFYVIDEPEAEES